MTHGDPYQMPNIALPAPVGGWNALHSLANMPPEDCIECVNMVPRADSLTTRPGYTAHSSALGGSVETLVTYHGATDHLICSANSKLINITAGGTGTNLKTSLTNDRWYTTEFKNRLILANGADGVQDWDGSTLTATSISGATSADLIYPHNHKGRVWYVEKDSTSAWYAGAGSYAGACTEYDFGQFTTTGGDLLIIATITRDGGSGSDDYFAAIFTTGEVLIYGGDDPGSATAWELVGRFQVAQPLGRRAATQVGGDVVLLTIDGYVSLSAALLSGRYSEEEALSYKISRAAKEAAQAYDSNFGWQGIHVPELSWYLVNVPISSTESVQHVRSTKTGGWCKFTGWDAASFTTYNNALYFGGTDGKVYIIQGTSDAGDFIPCKVVQAYQSLDLPHQHKLVTSVEPHMSFAWPKYVDVRFYSDFNGGITLPAYAEPPESVPSEWGVGEWNSALWETSAPGTNVARRPASAYGAFLAPVIRFSTRAQQVTWYMSNITFKKAGVI